MGYISIPVKFHRETTKTAHYRDFWDGESLGENSLETTARSVLEAEPLTFTGLYDSEGRELHRTRNPIGFMREG